MTLQGAVWEPNNTLECHFSAALFQVTLPSDMQMTLQRVK